MNKKDQRVLWIVNHNSLLDFEPKVLESLGYEVFVPKLFPLTSIFRSGGTSNNYDSNLSIPNEILKILNDYDFYDKNMSPHIRKIINSYFSIFFVHHLPVLKQAILHFKGHIVYRTYGTIYKTHEEILRATFGDGIKESIERLGNRFHFAVSFPDHEKSEPLYLQNSSMYLPYGMPDSVFEKGDVWSGRDPRLFFVCPVIADNEYYGKIYSDFKKKFKNIPHIIGGLQYKPVKDPSVLGKIDREEFDRILSELRVMYYQSTEPRLVHLHVLEAMAYGMPVIFMQQNMLGTLNDSIFQPGSCKTVSEAKNKVKRLISGDQQFATDIRRAQKHLTNQFTFQHCIKIWEKNFQLQKIEEQKKINLPECRIAVFLPAPYLGGTFDAAKSIAKMIHTGSREAGTPVTVIFSYVKDFYQRDDFKDLLDLGIDIRETHWVPISKETLAIALRMQGRFIDLDYPSYLTPRDEKGDFLDTDWWLIISDSMMLPPAPLRRYGVVIHDCLSRYFLEYQNESIEGRTMVARGADSIIATTPQTREDIISYHGVHPDKVYLAPIEFTLDISEDSTVDIEKENEYFLWPTNLALHKNHINAIEAILRYINEGGKLNVVITGVETEQLDIDQVKDEKVERKNIIEFRKIIRSHNILKKRISIKGNVSKEEYYHLIRNANFLWHPVLRDNGTFCVIEAAALGIPSLSSDYPQMKYISEYFNLNLSFFKPYSISDMSESLHYMEKNWPDKSDKLPSYEQIKNNYINKDLEYWKIISDII